ncbi:MAG: hypothetical protein Q4G00_03280 [Clostridia bacterium]|nr:hypothetical protein [Clostridia bacterium]
MKTKAMGVVNLCVPCSAQCRYCLLDSCHKTTGVSYERGKSLAKRMDAEIRQTHSDIRFFYYIGYCMDTPHLPDYVRFCREMGYASGTFLQMNGFRFREEKEYKELFQSLCALGEKSVDFTFYGNREYHDAFAGRNGDYDQLLFMLHAAIQAGITAQISAPLLQSNLHMADRLVKIWEQHQPSSLRFFLPHDKGRGKNLSQERLTKSDFENLSEKVKVHFSKMPHLTEAEWLAKGQFDDYTERTLTLNLRPEEIERWESMTASEILIYLERLDDQYLTQMPSARRLSSLYGNPLNDQLFRLRDLLLRWQQMYIRDNPSVYDMHDEAHHFSVHV